MTLRRRAYDAFLQHLLDGGLRPGQLVSQRALVALTGFPLNAVREMIPRLEADGLLTAIARRGLQVPDIDVAIVRNAFQLREMIEVAAVIHFAETAPDAAIAALRQTVDRLQEGARRGITAALLAAAQAADWAFHQALVDHMQNELVTRAHRVNIVRIRLIMAERTTLSRDLLPEALAEHAVVIAALERRDAPGAERALLHHLACARRRAMGLPVAEADQEPRQAAPQRSPGDMP